MVDYLWWRVDVLLVVVVDDLGVPRCKHFWDHRAYGLLRRGLQQLLRSMAERVDTLLPCNLIGLGPIDGCCCGHDEVLGSCDPQSCLRQLNARDQVIELLQCGMRVVVPIERIGVVV